MGAALVADLVDFLDSQDPERLARLRRRFRGDEEQELLDPDTICAPPGKLLLTKMTLALASLDSFSQTWDVRAPEVRDRLERSNIWSFTGAVLAFIGSGTSLTLILGSVVAKPHLVATASALGLIGGLLGLTAKFIRRDVWGNEDALLQAHKDLVAGAHAAKALALDLRPYVEANDIGEDPSVVETLIADANRLIGEMHSKLAALPGRASAA